MTRVASTLMRMSRGWIGLAWMIVAGIGLAYAESSGKTNPFAGKTVLLLSSYAEGYGSHERIVAGFFDGVIEAGGKAEDVHVEKLDLLRFTSDGYRQQLLALLRHKYGDKKLDLIVTTQQPALDFVRNEGRSLFGDIPLIAGFVHRQDNAPALQPNEVRLPYDVDFTGTLTHALALLPNTRRVVMVGGVHPTDRLFIAQAQQAFLPWRDRLTLEWLTDGDLSIFESGAILLHLGEKSDVLLPTDPRARSDAKAWLFAALASVEAASQPWSFFKFMGDADETPMRTFFADFLMAHRLPRMETVLAGREWLAGTFSIADILMSDVLRLVDRFDGLADFPACKAYVARATARPAFVKALADQMAHFAAAD